MNYTVLTLAALGMFGILLNNLMKLNTINRVNDGTINLLKYWKIERFSILLSMCLIAIVLIARTEIKQLREIGNWLGLGVAAIGYMAQSIITTFSGKAQKYLDKQSETPYSAPNDAEKQNKL